MRAHDSVLCVGPLCIDELEFEVDATRHVHPGGNAVITGATLARMGIATRVAGSVGADANGEWIRRTLSSHGVVTTGLSSEVGRATRVCRNGVRRDGTWYRSGASAASCPYLVRGLEASAYRDVVHLHVGALNAVAACPPLADLVGACRAAGMTVSVGLAGADFDRDAVDRLTHEDDLLICNADELSRAVAVPSTDLPRALARAKFRRCVVTLGGRGAAATWDGAFLAVDCGGAAAELTAASPEPSTAGAKAAGVVRSTVGAGDVFAGVLLAAVLSGLAARECLVAATRAATLSVRHPTWEGWLDARPSLDDLAGRRG